MKVLTIVPLVLLASCAADPTQLASMTLCDYTLNSPYGVQYPSREKLLEELSARGEDCQEYVHLRNPEPSTVINNQSSDLLPYILLSQ